jgi:hypothetical protein
VAVVGGCSKVGKLKIKIKKKRRRRRRGGKKRGEEKQKETKR